MNFENLDINKKDSDYEDLIYELLDDRKVRILLGDKEIDFFEEQISNIEEPGEEEVVYRKLKKRIERLSTPFADFAEEDSVFEKNIKKETRKKTREKIKVIVEKCKNGELDSIGKGYTAEVFQSKSCPKCCYKVVYDIEEYKKGCNIKEEALIQDVFSDINTGETKVPKPYYYKMTPDSHIMVMESLNAFTIEDAVNGKKNLPENFDLEKFIDSLKSFVRKMHSLGIHHRDLHGRNVLIDEKNGMPRVIDFGKAKTGCEQNLEDAYRNEDDIYIEERLGETIRYKPSDLEYIEEHYKELKKIIYKNKE